MLEFTWWCVVVSVLLGAVVGSTPGGTVRRCVFRQLPGICVGVAWVGVVPYAVLRMRRPAKVGSR
jgi:hypothetical protein